jgi:two-component system sensor histidine kinase/response regulator
MVNVSAIMERLGADTALLQELFEIFLLEYPRLLSEMESSLQQQDFKQARRLAHSIKGMCLDLGDDATAHLAFELEKTYGDEQRAPQEAVKTLAQKLDNLGGDLRHWLASQE